MTVGNRDCVGPDGFTAPDRVRVPAKPLRLVKVISELFEAPMSVTRVAGLASIA